MKCHEKLEKFDLKTENFWKIRQVKISKLKFPIFWIKISQNLIKIFKKND